MSEVLMNETLEDYARRAFDAAREFIWKEVSGHLKLQSKQADLKLMSFENLLSFMHGEDTHTGISTEVEAAHGQWRSLRYPHARG